MKVRSGFVSNSSSTSFILSYDPKSILKSTYELIDYISSNEVTDPILVIGKEISSGYDMFYLTPEMISWLIENKSKICLAYDGFIGLIDPVVVGSDDVDFMGEATINSIQGHLYQFEAVTLKKGIPAGNEILTIDRDDHSCKAPKEIGWYYL